MALKPKERYPKSYLNASMMRGHVATVSDEKLFGEATRELSSGVIDKDLLSKARVLAGGDKKRTEIEYIRLRIVQLKSDRRNHLLRTASGSARMKISSGGNGFRSYFSRFCKNYFIGVTVFCIAGIVAALLITNEVNGACDRFRLANDNYQGWVNWIDDQDIDIREMLIAPYGILVENYGQEVADNRYNFHRSETEFRIAKSRLNFTEFCFAK